MTKYRNVLIALAISMMLSLAASGCGSTSSSNGTPQSMSNGTMSHAGGPSDSSMPAQHSMGSGTMSGDNMGSSTVGAMKPLVSGADGTSPVAGGLRLKGSPTSFAPGRPSTLTLRVVNEKTGKSITKFESDQTKLMHLIVVNHDFTGFQHLHPKLQSDGRFTTTLTLPRAGVYQAIADFTTGGKRYALGSDLGSPGKAQTRPLPAPATVASVDGYEVKLSARSGGSGLEVPLSFTVSIDGKPYPALQPYLGAYGHLVALHKPDLAYSHVHPTSADLPAGRISFTAEFPTSGTYRLYLQFRAKGQVHVAPFTYVVK